MTTPPNEDFYEVPEEPEFKEQDSGFTISTRSSKNSLMHSDRSVVVVPISVLTMISDGDIEQAAIDEQEEKESSRRQTTLCCGCCCDVLKACLIVDAIYIVLTAVFLVLHIMGLSIFENNLYANTNLYDDDQYLATLTWQETEFYWTFIAKSSFGLLFGVLGIVGAVKFWPSLVLCTAIWYSCIETVVSGLTQRWPMVALGAFFAYPHIALFIAVGRKQLTRENYKNEKHCCFDKESGIYATPIGFNFRSVEK